MTGETRPGRRRRSATSAAASGPTTNSSYIYRDENGERLFRVVRGKNKRFHQERYENGQWKLGIRGVPRTLYNMPAVADAVTNHKVIWIAEGEKDVEALKANGLIATTNPGGAGKWKDEYSYMLLGAKRVHIIWDNDDRDPKTGKYPGQEHALQVEASLRGVGLTVRMFRAKTGKDAYDHFAAGHSIYEFVQERPGPALVVPETNGHSKAHTEGPQRLPAVFQLALFKLREHAAEKGLPQPRSTDKGYEACCPAHDDRNPSLGIMVGDEQPLVVSCQRGCTHAEIAEALDIDPREFSAAISDHNAATQKRLEFLRADAEARVVLASEAAPKLVLPVSDPLKYLTEPVPEYPYTVEELHITGSNTLVVSQYKAGKTTLMINLFRSVVNVEPFLGHFEVIRTPGRVAYLDYEMQRAQFQAWLAAGGGLNYDRMVAPWHLRGQSLHFWVPGVRDRFVDWLQRHEVSVLIIDTAARAWSGLVDNENDNTQILRFTDTLDNIKEEAGVIDLFLVTHMGRDRFVPEGEERARGATRLEDWMDTGWYLTKDDAGTRYLRALGRGVDQDAFALTYEPSTHQLLTSGVSKKEYMNQTALQQVVDIIASFDGAPSMTELKDMLGSGDNTQKHKWILEAETRGLIQRVQGQGRTKKCELTEAGLRLHQRKIDVNLKGRKSGY